MELAPDLVQFFIPPIIFNVTLSYKQKTKQNIFFFQYECLTSTFWFITRYNRRIKKGQKVGWKIHGCMNFKSH